jgi:hypothetical protein
MESNQSQYQPAAAWEELSRRLDQLAGLVWTRTAQLEEQAERALLLAGRQASWQLAGRTKLDSLADVEFRVFSQWGEDGVIEWLVQQLPIAEKIFVEFGVESYREANTRFLLLQRNWRGLVMDSSEAHMAQLRAEALYWRHDLKAATAFVTAENIDGLLRANAVGGPIGLLSIDVDGNDVWVLDTISAVSPAILVCEVNPILGDLQPLAVPYEPDFHRFRYHPSGLYFGASIAAMRLVAERKGYVFLGTGTSGINAFFVRGDLAAHLEGKLARRVAHPARHRDSRNAQGQLTFAAGIDRLLLIDGLPAVHLGTGERRALRDFGPLYSAEWLADMGAA